MFYSNNSQDVILIGNYSHDMIESGTENIEVNWDINQSTCTIVSTDNSDWVQSVIVVQRAEEREASRPKRHEVYGIMRKSATRGSRMRSRGRSRCARESPQFDKIENSATHSVYDSQSYDSSVQDSLRSSESRVMAKAKGWKRKLQGFF